MSTSDIVEAVSPCLRRIGEDGRVFPKGRRVEVVFTVDAENFLLLRTEGPGDINEATLPEAGIDVPVIQPQKLMAVVRRRLLQALRAYRDSGADLTSFIMKAKELGFKKAEEHLVKGWNCTIQPPLAQSGEKMTDVGMDGYCPACTIFGAALTEAQYEQAGGEMSIGIKTRVHFDPAFATTRKVLPETHNKVSEGTLSTTGGALYTDIHVMPGTVFVGRVTMHDLTLPELLAVLYSLATVEEVGGRAGVYGTVRVNLLGIRCGEYSLASALDLADMLAREGVERPSEARKRLSSILKDRGFKPLSNNVILSLVRVDEKEGVFKELWESSIDYVEQMHNWVKSLKSSKGKRARKKK